MFGLSALSRRLQQSEGPAAAPSGPYAGSETILLVEDDPSVRGLFAEALKRAGYRVVEARNGLEALSLFDREGDAINLLVTDINMPYLGGTELASRLTTLRPNLRMVYVSGYVPQMDLPSHAAFLAKPFLREELLKTVRRLLDTKI